MIPQLRAWHETYAGRGLTVIGVHTPEFFWEKRYQAVQEAVRTHRIAYPVVLDNDGTAWNRYQVRAWPTLVLVDRVGVVRYRHIGEGAYEETEAVIRRLLAE